MQTNDETGRQFKEIYEGWKKSQEEKQNKNCMGCKSFSNASSSSIFSCQSVLSHFPLKCSVCLAFFCISLSCPPSVFVISSPFSLPSFHPNLSLVLLHPLLFSGFLSLHFFASLFMCIWVNLPRIQILLLLCLYIYNWDGGGGRKGRKEGSRGTPAETTEE